MKKKLIFLIIFILILIIIEITFNKTFDIAKKHELITSTSIFVLYILIVSNMINIYDFIF